MGQLLGLERRPRLGVRLLHCFERSANGLDVGFELDLARLLRQLFRSGWLEPQDAGAVGPRCSSRQ